MHLVLLETSGNQHYIFDTNKLRENVGASELTYRAGTQWVLEAVGQNGGPKLWDANANKLRENLCNGEKNKPIEDGAAVEVLVATSGKALLLVKEREVGQAIVSAVTAKALECAPGLDISGVISDGFDWENGSLDAVNSKVHQEFEQARTRLPGPDLRFLRLPVVAPCATSGLPAAEWDVPRDEQGQPDERRAAARSKVSANKQGEYIRALRRMQTILGRKTKETPDWIKFADNIGELEQTEVVDLDKEPSGDNSLKELEKRDWLAVVHADGNGLGEIFLNFERSAGTKSNREYVDTYRQFSVELDKCTERAFLSALAAFEPGRKNDIVPLVPLVLGGDDMTVVCDGRYALPFTRQFLENFETETNNNDVIKPIAKNALKDERLSACAGVAIVKTHFPFSTAYSLAEELIRSAKVVKEKVTKKHTNDKREVEDKAYPCSALDFHVLYDTSNVSLDGIRAKLLQDVKKDNSGIVTSETRLYGRPYVITALDKLAGADDAAGKVWSETHHWKNLTDRVEALHAKDDNGRRKLPNSQVHDLRAGLFTGKQHANQRYQLIRHRYEKEGIDKLEGESGSLFWTETEKTEDKDGKEQDLIISVTGLLDAVEAAEFLKGDVKDE